MNLEIVNFVFNISYEFWTLYSSQLHAFDDYLIDISAPSGI